MRTVGGGRLFVLEYPSCRVCRQEMGTTHAPDCEIQRVAEIVGLPVPVFWYARCYVCPWCIDTPFTSQAEAAAQVRHHHMYEHPPSSGHGH